MDFANLPLTKVEKEWRLSEWERKKAEPRPSGNLGGTGWPDPEIFASVDRLNAIDGVCTTQSCSGHLLKSALDGREYVENGHLWIRLSGTMRERFLNFAHTLAAREGIERLALLYHGDEGELIDIHFRGLGDSGPTLNRSMAIICDFFEFLGAS